MSNYFFKRLQEMTQKRTRATRGLVRDKESHKINKLLSLCRSLLSRWQKTLKVTDIVGVCACSIRAVLASWGQRGALQVCNTCALRVDGGGGNAPTQYRHEVNAVSKACSVYSLRSYRSAHVAEQRCTSRGALTIMTMLVSSCGRDQSRMRAPHALSMSCRHPHDVLSAGASMFLSLGWHHSLSTQVDARAARSYVLGSTQG